MKLSLLESLAQVTKCRAKNIYPNLWSSKFVKTTQIANTGVKFSRPIRPSPTSFSFFKPLLMQKKRSHTTMSKQWHRLCHKPKNKCHTKIKCLPQIWKRLQKPPRIHYVQVKITRTVREPNSKGLYCQVTLLMNMSAIRVSP